MVEDTQQTAGGRRFRLRQLKKILPSDRISVEKHFPRFYEKCQKIQRRQLENLADDNNNDTVGNYNIDNSNINNNNNHNNQNNDDKENANNRNRNTKWDDKRRAVSDAGVDSEEEEVDEEVTTPAEKEKEKEVAAAATFRQNRRNAEDAGQGSPIVVPMADHLEGMTLQRGCWLQATLSTPCDAAPAPVLAGRTPPPPPPPQQQHPPHGHPTVGQQQQQQQPAEPKIVFIHRKSASLVQRSRADLAREVLREFERQKRLMPAPSRRCSAVDKTLHPIVFQRQTTGQKSLPVGHSRPSAIDLQSRRVS